MQQSKQQSKHLAKILEPYKTGWVALNKEETQVLAHAETFAEIAEKVKDQDINEVVLSPVMRADAYFIGSCLWLNTPIG